MVSVTIVTWNSAKYLEECFAALSGQDHPHLEVIVVDNASEDATREVLKRVDSRRRVIYNDENVGFAAGQNQAIRASRGEWVLCLNPDVLLSPEFISQLVRAGEAHTDAGSLCGKLLRWGLEILVSYQGTTSVVPNGLQTGEGFSPWKPQQGLKPVFLKPESARLKPCPDTRPAETGADLNSPKMEIKNASRVEDADPRKTNI